MHNVIKLLKSFSYADEPLKDGLELAPLIEQSLSLFKDSLREKNVMINLLELEKSVYVKVNTLKLDLVLVNLIQNALDAMEKTNHPVITVGMHSFQNNALITIEDVGGGIDSRVMGQLFNPYFTTKEIGKGLGLGLSICYEIIQEYGGSIDAENTEQGARFIIKLPLDQVMH
jgi:two-component system C4-dicarboxylate transport sensor histidine kinase DctB